jgi:hypothetical protein
MYDKIGALLYHLYWSQGPPITRCIHEGLCSTATSKAIATGEVHRYRRRNTSRHPRRLGWLTTLANILEKKPRRGKGREGKRAIGVMFLHQHASCIPSTHRIQAYRVRVDLSLGTIIGSYRLKSPPTRLRNPGWFLERRSTRVGRGGGNLNTKKAVDHRSRRHGTHLPERRPQCAILPLAQHEAELDQSNLWAASACV